MEENLIEKESKLKAFSIPFQHSKRMQMALVLLFFVSCFTFLFVLENRLAEQQKQLEFAYKEFYLRPFHYKLDPFSYVELKNGSM
jgi:cell division protein FtsB